MTKLDSRTLDRLANLIVDMGGSFERSGRQLERLLQDCGWLNAPAYDGSARIPWLIDALMDRDENSSEIERLLCRVCHPVEYDDGRPSSEAVRAEVNHILEPERLTVTLLDGQPLLGELNSLGSDPVAGAPPNMDSRLRNLISDEAMIDLLLGRIREVETCQAHGAYLLALIGIGSFVEGLLFTVLQEHDANIRQDGFVGRNGKRLDPSYVSLAVLIDTAHSGDWIELDAKHFIDRVRDYRNFVHPRKQAETGLMPNADTLMMCWAPIRAILNDLEVSIGTARHLG